MLSIYRRRDLKINLKLIACALTVGLSSVFTGPGS